MRYPVIRALQEPLAVGAESLATTWPTGLKQW